MKKIGKILQKKVDEARDKKMVEAALKTDVSGLSKQEKMQKLLKAIDKAKNDEIT